MKSRAILTTFEGHSQPLTCLAFSENGYYLATGAADATVKLWDLRKLQSFHTIEPDSASMAVSDVAFDHSGQVLAVARGSVSLFETKAWATLAVHEEHPAPASAVGFGQCAAFFASASEDGVLRLYGSH
jgi:pre-mRNA-processing factor 19